MKRRMRYLTMFFISLFFMPGISFGDDGTYIELLNEIKALKTKVASLEKRVAKYEGKEEAKENAYDKKESFIRYKPGEGITVPEAGFDMGASVSFVAQGTPNANNAEDGEDSIFDGSWKGNVEISKEFSDWGLALIEFESGQNEGIENELNLFSNVNANACGADSAVNISKFFYEHYFFDKGLALTFGKLDAGDYVDQNEYAASDATQFLGRIFKHSPAAEFPSDNTLGLTAYLCIEPINFVEFQAGYFEADSDWDDMFDNSFYSFQANVRPELVPGLPLKDWPGNYRVYAWINDEGHAKLVDEGGGASDDTKEINYGFGLSFDQSIYEGVGIFGRLGWQRPDIIMLDESATLEWVYSAGAQLSGSYWNRNEDVIAFAFGQAFPGEEYGDAGNGGRGEGHLELYYRCRINKCLAISPDFQVIWNPNGAGKSSEGDDDAIFVYGVRGVFDF